MAGLVTVNRDKMAMVILFLGTTEPVKERYNVKSWAGYAQGTCMTCEMHRPGCKGKGWAGTPRNLQAVGGCAASVVC